MGRPASFEAASISAALASSGVVGHSMASKPASLASWNPSRMPSDRGSILNSTALRIGRRAGAAAAAAKNGAAAADERNPRRVVNRVVSIEQDSTMKRRPEGFRLPPAPLASSYGHVPNINILEAHIAFASRM